MATKRNLDTMLLKVEPRRVRGESRLPLAEVTEIIGGRAGRRRPVAGLVVGALTGIGAAGEPLVDFSANRERVDVAARSIVPVHSTDIGRGVALLFEDGDPGRPIVIGLIQQLHGPSAIGAPGSDTKAHDVEIDGERLVFTAQKEIVLRCGAATITLTRAGKVLIRGAHLLSRSSGVNRIKGGSVQIN